MADESSSWDSVDESTTIATATAAIGSTTRLRKKRKWDQPAEILVSAGISVPGIHPMTNVGLGPVVGVPLPGVAPVARAPLANPLTPGGVLIPHGFQVSSIQQHPNAAIQKLIQPKIQDELIAREIVINEAESTIRYKLTKRQTQEEIQRCTGAVVITRGKYRPPGALPDGEKPLYLHISAGAHLKEVAKRIIAVDQAAAMVEEMLKSGHNSQSVLSSFQAMANNVVKALSTRVYLGFDADPSANISARIRGPNGQYINHIMNETGAAVKLRGRGAENVEDLHAEENQQPLHLYLSSNSPKSLEDAKRLAENLLDTISVEFGAARASSLKLYNAVPPQEHLLAGVQSSGHAVEVIPGPNACLTSSAVGSSPVSPLLPIPRVAPIAPSVGTFVAGQSLPHYLPPLSSGTSYNGYGGIYPQATPLQQVALALRQSTSPTTPNVIVSTIPQSSDTSASDKEKGRPNRRKFQELPAVKGHTRQHEVSEFGNPSKPFMAPVLKNVSTLLAPNKSVHSSSSVMPPPPPRIMPPPPPPPKFTSSVDSSKNPERKNIKASSKSDIIPDTLIKLTEYGDDDDDDDDLEDTTEKNSSSNLAAATTPKPFWAL